MPKFKKLNNDGSSFKDESGNEVIKNFTSKQAEKLLAMKNCKWLLIEVEKPKDPKEKRKMQTHSTDMMKSEINSNQ